MDVKRYKIQYPTSHQIKITGMLLRMLADYNVVSLQATKCAYGLIVMAILWLTEALPIPVTALLPVVLFPLLGVSPGKTVCEKFLNVRCFFFLFLNSIIL